MSKFEGIDVNKLVFKKEYKEAGKITIRVPALNRHYPVSKDVLRESIASGNHHEKIQSLFTPESIKQAMKKTETKKSDSK